MVLFNILYNIQIYPWLQMDILPFLEKGYLSWYDILYQAIFGYNIPKISFKILWYYIRPRSRKLDIYPGYYIIGYISLTSLIVGQLQKLEKIGFKNNIESIGGRGHEL